MVRMRRLVIWLVAILVVGLPIAAAAQRGGGGFFGFGRGRVWDNVAYDGKFTFARIRYNRGAGRWAADYPTMERNLTEMMNELTAMPSHAEGSNVHDFDDPELLKYPVAYLTEPGFWYPSEPEVRGLQEYLAKGGFLIVDDFHFDNEWWVFESGLRKAWPDARIVPLEVTHPIFNAFFQIKSLHIPYPGNLGESGLYGEFYGIYEDNDPSKRLAMIINYNMDVGDYVEWAQSSRSYSFEPTNEAYKLMINYVMYGLTH